MSDRYGRCRLLTDTLLTGCAKRAVVTVLLSAILWLAPSAGYGQQTPWTRVAIPAPGGNPANVALLTDGRILVSGTDSTQYWNAWWTLTPDATGSYANGTWSNTPILSAYGRVFNPAAILPDGRYWVCGGEYVCPASDYNCGIQDGNWDDCEIFDPAANQWSPAPTMSASGISDYVHDIPSALTNAGVVVLSADASGNTFTFNSFSSSWTLTGTYSTSDITNEGGSLVLPDGSVLAGANRFDRYQSGTGLWSAVASTATIPGGVDYGEFLTAADTDGEIGPFLLLYSGQALILGVNSLNGLYNYQTNAWSLADNTPVGPNPNTPYNHGDTPACVEPDGNVLTIVTNDQGGVGSTEGFIYEFNPSAASGAQWSAVADPSFSSQKAGNPERSRMVALPRGNLGTGQILVTNLESDGTIWLYTPHGSPLPSWQPTITSSPVLIFGTFSMIGTQLNGLTTGGDFGDDGKTATNYPIVSLWNGSGQVSYARTTMHDSVVPGPGLSGAVWFKTPASMSQGTYSVHVSASGVDSSNTVTLVLPATDVGPAVNTAAQEPLI